MTLESAMARMHAAEATARHRFGGPAVRQLGLGRDRGVDRGALYQEIRSLRIYEGTTEIQKIIIAKHILGKDQSAALRRVSLAGSA